MLKDKVCVITGSSRGIGKAVALDFAKKGAKLIINATSESEAAISTLSEIRKLGAECELVVCNIKNPDEAQRLIDTAIEKFSKVDVLVNNAGITKDKLMIKMSEADWDDVLDVNLKGAFNCIKAAARPMMRQKGASIINITSVVGMTGNAGQANYSASKAGLIGLTKTVAKEFSKKGLRCNAVAPGFIESDMTDALPEEIKNTYLDSIPLQRFGRGEDVAKLCAFLASDLSDYITGQVINVDGGLVM